MLLENNEENRNCGCNQKNMENMDCSYTPEGINAAFGYNTCNNDELANLNCECACNKQECCNERNQVRSQMYKQIQCLGFSIVELAEYLDTHPDDQKALCLHKEYCKQLRDLKDQYQKVFGPLSINYPCNKWRWLEEPWPWEGGNF